MRIYRRWPPLGFLVAAGLLIVVLLPVARQAWNHELEKGDRPVSALDALPDQLLVGGQAEIAGVLDGRTLAIRQGDRLYHVRLLGLELSNGTESHAQAQHALETAAPLGPTFLELDKRRIDSDGAWLAHVYLAGRPVAAAVIRAGWGRYAAYPGDSFAVGRLLKEAENEARYQKRGIWAGE